MAARGGIKSAGPSAQRRHMGGTMVGRMPIIMAGATTEGTLTPLIEVASGSIRMPWHTIAAVQIGPAAGRGTGAAATSVATAGSEAATLEPRSSDGPPNYRAWEAEPRRPAGENPR
jgi:hypothetical protein